MMLRFICFVSLLLSLSLTEQEFLRPRKRHLRSCYKRGKINRKRENYNNFYDKESMDLIDVASFIQNPDDSSFEGNQDSENRLAASNYADEGSNSNVKDERDQTQDYQGLKSGNIPEVNIYSGRRIPQYLNRKSPEETNSEHITKTNAIKNDDLVDTNIKLGHKGKKSVFKKMKIPFFSRDKVVTTSKTKRNKKRKLFSLYCTRNNSTKSSERNFNNKEINLKRQSVKINKRSNFESLCPACKQRILLNSYDYLDKIRRTASGGIHNSRQFYQQKQLEEAARYNNEQTNSIDLKNQDPNTDNKDLNDIIYNKRWRRNAELSIKREEEENKLKSKTKTIV